MYVMMVSDRILFVPQSFILLVVMVFVASNTMALTVMKEQVKFERLGIKLLSHQKVTNVQPSLEALQVLLKKTVQAVQAKHSNCTQI